MQNKKAEQILSFLTTTVNVTNACNEVNGE